jgi:hypothetical protein
MTLETPVPPRWERARAAAERLGYPSASLLASDLAVGRYPIQVRTTRLGRGNLLHLWSADVDALRRISGAPV